MDASIITVDSNDARVVEGVARHLRCEPIIEWCTDVERCDRFAASLGVGRRVFRNTPIAMSRDATSFFSTSGGGRRRRVVHFVHVDPRLRNDALRRIVRNLRVAAKSSSSSSSSVVVVLLDDRGDDDDDDDAADWKDDDDDDETRADYERLVGKATYVLSSRHADVETRAEIVALIVDAFVYNECRLVHPDDIIAGLCGRRVNARTSVREGMRLDITGALRRKNECRSTRLDEDCNVCVS